MKLDLEKMKQEKENERINSEINVSKERISNNKENFNRFDKEIEEIKARNTGLEEEKNAKLEKKNNLFTNKEKFQKELEEKEKELEELTKKLSDKELEIESKKKIQMFNYNI